MKLLMPPRELIPRPNLEDPLIYYYLPFIGYVYRKRLINTLELLGSGYNNLIDIGFGSGILFPELNTRASNLFGIDIHEKIDDVSRMLKALKINADLKFSSVYKMPYQDNFFDAAVSVSVFEHLKDLDTAFLALSRVLKTNGCAVISFPVRNFITDIFFRIAGFNPRKLHPSSHRDIIGAASRHFEIEKILTFPKFLPTGLSLYCSIRCKKIV